MSNTPITIDPAQFLSSFCFEQGQRDAKNQFDKLSTFCGSSIQIASFMNHSKVCPGIKFAGTRDDPSDARTQRVLFVPGYPAQHAPAKSHIDYARLVLSIYTLSQNHDPFGDREGLTWDDELEHDEVLQQIESHAALAFKYGQRTFHFTILLLGELARLVRWDRSGVIITGLFAFKTEPHLVDFLSRFSRMSIEERGMDPTATLLTSDDDDYRLMDEKAAIALEDGDHARELFQKSLEDNKPRWRLSVLQDDGTTHEFLVAEPHFTADFRLGRGTRGYVALDLEASRVGGAAFVFLKDVWRLLGDPNLQREGDTLGLLREKGVPHVPTLVCHGDVNDQLTVSHEYWTPPSAEEEPESHVPLPLRHYRMVVKEVGVSFSNFRNSREFVGAFLQCLTAHQWAYLDAEIIHGDVSAGNMLLVPYWITRSSGKRVVKYDGMLNDWELSRPITPLHNGQSTSRLGTWSFESLRRMNEPAIPITLEDELESFFHVFLYFGIRYFPTNCSDVEHLLRSYFDNHGFLPGGGRSSQLKDMCMVGGAIMLPGSFAVLEFRREAHNGAGGSSADVSGRKHPLNAVLTKLQSWFQGLYRHRRYVRERENPRVFHLTPARVGDEEDSDSDSEDEAYMSELMRRTSRSHATTSIVTRPSLTPEQQKAIDLKEEARCKRLRDNLLDHEEMKQVFIKPYLKREIWPRADRTQEPLAPVETPAHGSQEGARARLLGKRACNVDEPLCSWKRARQG